MIGGGGVSKMAAVAVHSSTPHRIAKDQEVV